MFQYFGLLTSGLLINLLLYSALVSVLAFVENLAMQKFIVLLNIQNWYSVYKFSFYYLRALFPGRMLDLYWYPGRYTSTFSCLYCMWQVLKVFPYPINITEVQFAVGTVVSLFLWITGIIKRPKISGAQVTFNI